MIEMTPKEAAHVSGDQGSVNCPLGMAQMMKLSETENFQNPRHGGNNGGDGSMPLQKPAELFSNIEGAQNHVY